MDEKHVGSTRTKEEKRHNSSLHDSQKGGNQPSVANITVLLNKDIYFSSIDNRLERSQIKTRKTK